MWRCNLLLFFLFPFRSLLILKEKAGKGPKELKLHLEDTPCTFGRMLG